MTTSARPTSLARVGVVDAGEHALRLIGAVREYRMEHERDIRVVALHTTDDTDNLWVRDADEAVLVAGDGWTDAAAVERALEVAAVDAVWDGAGSLQARPVLASCCEHLGIRRIGAATRPAAVDQTAGNSRPAASIDGRVIEVHALVDADGTTLVLGMCEGMPLIESTRLSPAMERTLSDEARRAVAGATGAG
ncbi:MAG TPA: biotin carboxylase N-terminal domain-containing protein, partial [Ilumatobacteraceae bacterium]|nr:biotin carboxylase N-terminal domain-containing protein [Ilumatobacteraceae bacterium]